MYVFVKHCTKLTPARASQHGKRIIICKNNPPRFAGWPIGTRFGDNRRSCHRHPASSSCAWPCRFACGIHPRRRPGCARPGPVGLDRRIPCGLPGSGLDAHASGAGRFWRARSVHATLVSRPHLSQPLRLDNRATARSQRRSRQHHGRRPHTRSDIYREAVGDARWWNQGTPLWTIAQRHGLHTGIMFWPGSEAPVHGSHPDFWSTYDKKMASFGIRT
jgi:hypothetical protein